MLTSNNVLRNSNLNVGVVRTNTGSKNPSNMVDQTSYDWLIYGA